MTTWKMRAVHAMLLTASALSVSAKNEAPKAGAKSTGMVERAVNLRPDDVTAIVASHGSLSGNLLKSGHTVHGFDTPRDMVTWTVNAPKEDDYAVSVLFLDGNIKALEEGYLKRNIGGSKKKATMDGYHTMMEETVAALGSDKLMVANIIRARFPEAGLEYMNYFDGSYIEAFEHAVGGMSREEYIAKGIDAIQQAARKGKIIAFCMGLGKAGESEMGIDETRAKATAIDEDRMNYCLALFLVCAEKYSYCHIHDGYHVDGKVESKTWGKSIPFYDKKLGAPKGPARKKNFIYVREFEHALVGVDIKTKLEGSNGNEQGRDFYEPC